MAVSEFGVARALFRIAVPTWESLGFSFNRMIAEAKSMGLSYRRTAMLGDIRAVTGLIKGAYGAMRAPRDQLFPKSKMLESDLGRPRRYRVYGKATMFNETTGEETEKTVSFYTNRNASPDVFANDFQNKMDQYAYETGVTVTNFDVIGVEHNEGWQY